MNSFGWLQNVSLWNNNENFETQSYDFESKDFDIYFNQYNQLKSNEKMNVYNYTNGSIVNKKKELFDGKTVFTGNFNNGAINKEGIFIKGRTDSEFYFFLQDHYFFLVI